MRIAKFLRAFFPLLVMPFFLFETNIFAAATAVADDYVPEVTARVARISFLRGDVQIKRADSADWERATLNLPLVEGDQITTDVNARIEIQFDRDSFLRLAENSYLKITTLRDEGIALSLPQGTLSLRVLNFDKSRNYYEIDAPQTTLSVQKTGMYRIDAGDKNSNEIRVTATDGGEARVYSENSGFTLRSGRSAKIYLEGNYAGEWETSDASRYADEWDAWVLERDARIAKQMREAYYDKYYDRDMYGAEDLNDYGKWVYTKKYGWVWKPYRDSVADYADWSPYRYGQWRWIPPYGWTWVNDEPWGWATYHHGRWVYVNGDWCWTPYAFYRPRRSWWQPALVVVTWSGNLVCWYPLPYDYGYYNYNSYYYRRRRQNNYYNTTIINNTTVVVNPTPTPNASPTPSVVVVPSPLPGKGPKTPPLGSVPPSGVVTIAKEQFGNQIKGTKTAPLEIAKQILSKTPTPDVEMPPILPVGIDKQTAKTKNEILVEKPRFAKTEVAVKTGVIDRKPGVAMDEEIRQKKVFEDRKPVMRQSGNGDDKTVKGGINAGGAENPVRNTGAIEREPQTPIRQPVRPNDRDTEIKQNPRNDVPPRDRSDDINPPPPPVRQPRNEQPTVKPRREEPPLNVPPPPTVREQPRDRDNEPVRQPQPQQQQPTQRERPREEPRREQPKPQEAPRKEEPKNDSKPTEVKGGKNNKDGLDR